MAGWITGFFNAIGGKVVECCTLVDFYTYIKAVEYLICIGFFVTFPLFYKYVIKQPGESPRESVKSEKNR